MNLPIYKIMIDFNDEETGLTAVSLVDYPAVEKDFLLFDKQDLLFTADDEKQIISGIALLADTPIYRRNERGEYYVVFEKDTIRQLVEKYSKQGLLNTVNLQHQSDTFVKDVYMIESYLIDRQRGICPVEFKDVPDGSWYVSYFVEDKELWNEIKNGDIFNGFSVEISAHLEMNANTNKENNDMNKFFKLAKMLLKLGEVKTDKATLIIEGELEVGKPVFIEVEGEPVPAEDGEYTMEDGTVVVVTEGAVAEIRPVETEPVTIETEEEAPITEPEPEPNAEVEELKAKIAELEATIAEKDAKIAELEGSIKKYESDSLKTKLALGAHLKPDAWKYISGNTEDEIKESIAGLNDLLKGAGSAPSGSSEDAVTKEGANRAKELAQLKALRGGES